MHPLSDHSCARAPVRICFNCGSEDHIKAAGNQGRCCYKCGSSEHIARDCQNQFSGCWASQRAWWPSWGISRVRCSPGEPLDTRTTANHCSAYACRNKWTGILWYHGRQCHSWSHTRESTGQGPPYWGVKLQGIGTPGRWLVGLGSDSTHTGGITDRKSSRKAGWMQ